VPRGGRRTGTPGQSYSNRSDLNANRGAVPMMAAAGQTYGKKSEQMAAQRAMPIARPATDTVPTAPARPTGGTPGGPPPMPPGPTPGQVLPLDAPTTRPGEPLTAGLPIGPGAGPEANPFSAVGSADDAVLAIRAAFAAYPAEELRAILERVDLG
jgi:hypothetical protein